MIVVGRATTKTKTSSFFETVTERFNQCFSKSLSLENLVFISYFVSKAFYGKMFQAFDPATFSKEKK